MSVSPTPTFSDDNINKKLKDEKLVIFRIKRADLLKEGLICDPDKPNHESVQPSGESTVEDFQNKIRNTWNKGKYGNLKSRIKKMQWKNI